MKNKYKIYNLSKPLDYNLEEELLNIGVSKDSINIMLPKFQFYRFYIRELSHRAANILKQEALSCGGEAAISYTTYSMKPDKSDILLSCTKKQLNILIEKLKLQPFGLKDLSFQLKDIVFSERRTIKIGKRDFNWREKVYIMGIINVTPDSFYPGSRVIDKDLLLKKVKTMVDEGVDIIDIGGESTRPGAEKVNEEEELERVIPAIELIKQNFDVPVSIDTYKSKVAEESFKVGADLLNDISALRFDDNMINILNKYKKPVCIMHMKGTPKTMQKNPSYKNLIDEIYDFFYERIYYLLENNIEYEQIIIDPGIGFGKRLEDNLRLIKFLRYFTSFNLPILFAGSRKSFIGMILNKDVEERLYGTISAHLLAAINGASFLRVHDVKEMKDVLKIYEVVKNVSRFEY